MALNAYKVARHAVAQRLGLAHIDNFPLGIFHEIDAWQQGQRTRLAAQPQQTLLKILTRSVFGSCPGTPFGRLLPGRRLAPRLLPRRRGLPKRHLLP